MTTSAKDLYLILYNNACCVGWAMVWLIAVGSVATGLIVDQLPVAQVLANVYAADGLAMMLIFCQTAALLEIVHAATGLVRSPVAVTAMQVMSRIVALVAIVYSKEAQSASAVLPYVKSATAVPPNTYAVDSTRSLCSIFYRL